jgi:hypothetical protein
VGVAPQELNGVSAYLHPVQGLNVTWYVRQYDQPPARHFLYTVSAAALGTEVPVTEVRLMTVTPADVYAVRQKVDLSRSWVGLHVLYVLIGGNEKSAALLNTALCDCRCSRRLNKLGGLRLYLFLQAADSLFPGAASAHLIKHGVPVR